jgi:hypothetical protein
VRKDGLHWIWPWMGKEKLSRARAQHPFRPKVKINDLRGNPIEIACNVVWRVADTAQAVFDVDDYKEFVNIQIEAGLRTVGSRHPYDDMSDEDDTTLRGSADLVNRGADCGSNSTSGCTWPALSVDEAGLTHLAYASGNRRCHAAPPAGRCGDRRAPEGRDRRGQHGRGCACRKLSSDGVVDLDEERKAAMVSNLMVVLCGDREAQPVVNTGTLVPVSPKG